MDRMYVPRKYTEGQNSKNYDVAFVILDQNLGLHLGYFGIMYTDVSFERLLTTAGYPGDKNVDSVWTMSKQTTVDVNNERLNHALDTAKGQSGSPIYGLFKPRSINNNEEDLEVCTSLWAFIRRGFWVKTVSMRLLREVKKILLFVLPEKFLDIPDSFAKKML